MRLRGVWLLILPFLWWASPSSESLLLGAAVAAFGLAIRAWAAGVIHKERELTVAGPYARTRNPLYLGTFFLGLGVAIGGGVWPFIALFLLFFFVVYRSTMKQEAELLEELFGDIYRAYARAVPLFLPRLTPYRPEVHTGPAQFEVSRYFGHREYEALLGTVAGFGLLAAKLWFDIGA